jgi:hypothetical protein
LASNTRGKEKITPPVEEKPVMVSSNTTLLNGTLEYLQTVIFGILNLQKKKNNCRLVSLVV